MRIVIAVFVINLLVSEAQLSSADYNSRAGDLSRSSFYDFVTLRPYVCFNDVEIYRVQVPKQTSPKLGIKNHQNTSQEMDCLMSVTFTLEAYFDGFGKSDFSFVEESVVPYAEVAIRKGGIPIPRFESINYREAFTRLDYATVLSPKDETQFHVRKDVTFHFPSGGDYFLVAYRPPIPSHLRVDSKKIDFRLGAVLSHSGGASDKDEARRNCSLRLGSFWDVTNCTSESADIVMEGEVGHVEKVPSEFCNVKYPQFCEDARENATLISRLERSRAFTSENYNPKKDEVLSRKTMGLARKGGGACEKIVRRFIPAYVTSFRIEAAIQYDITFNTIAVNETNLGSFFRMHGAERKSPKL